MCTPTMTDGGAAFTSRSPACFRRMLILIRLCVSLLQSTDKACGICHCICGNNRLVVQACREFPGLLTSAASAVGLLLKYDPEKRAIYASACGKESHRTSWQTLPQVGPTSGRLDAIEHKA
jgi:hypothetical protein